MHIGTDAKSVSALLGVESTCAASHDGGSIKGRTSLVLSDISRTKQRWHEMVTGILTITYKMYCGNSNVNCCGVPWWFKYVFKDPAHLTETMYASIIGLDQYDRGVWVHVHIGWQW